MTIDTNIENKKKVICTKCIYDDSISGITFNEQGVCNYCEMIDHLIEQYGTGSDEGGKKLNAIIGAIKKEGTNKRYDCVVGVSGGTDSSFMLHKAIELGLRPLAVHYDNTWNTSIATENIRKITAALGVDLYTYVVDNKEMDNIFLSFFKSSVPELDGPTDIALAQVLYKAAAQYGIKFILEGHSFMAEGVSPLSASYVDGRYIVSIHKRFGSSKMKSFPNMSFTSFLKWITIKRIYKIRPLWYINYSKDEAREVLESKYGWQYYGGHHLENRMTAFNHIYYLPVKFNIDQRNNSLSASVRSGLLPRDTAIDIYAKKPEVDPELLEYFKKRLALSESEFTKIMAQPNKSYVDYPTYKKLFERLRVFFLILAKANLVPMSFYLKYCFPAKVN